MDTNNQRQPIQTVGALEVLLQSLSADCLFPRTVSVLIGLPDQIRAQIARIAELELTKTELLEALKEMVASYEHEGSSQNPSLLKAVSVIAKAEGSS